MTFYAKFTALSQRVELATHDDYYMQGEHEKKIQDVSP